MKPFLGLSYRKKLLFSCIIFGGALLIFEVGARIVFYAKEDFNPYYLKFGFVHDIESHSDEYRGYSKFQPNTYKHQKVRGQTHAMKINGDGFRGLHDFVRPKPNNVFRIATLGASSTFGYYVKDDETYPYQVEQILRELYPNKSIEVLNLGIPHARLNNIVALAKQELPTLEPDLITLYAGYNNAVLPKDPKKAGTMYRLKNWLYFHSVGWRLIHFGVKNIYFSVMKTTKKDIVDIPNLAVPLFLNNQKLEDLRHKVTEDFSADIISLIDIAEELGCPLMFVTQNYSLRNMPGSELQDQWRTYAEEVELLKQLRLQKKGLNAIQTTKIIHRDFMNVLQNTFKKGKNNLFLIDGISPVEGDSSNMKSYVHLSKIGNKLLAEAMSKAIVDAKLVSKVDTHRLTLRGN